MQNKYINIINSVIHITYIQPTEWNFYNFLVFYIDALANLPSNDIWYYSLCVCTRMVDNNKTLIQKLYKNEIK